MKFLGATLTTAAVGGLAGAEKALGAIGRLDYEPQEGKDILAMSREEIEARAEREGLGNVIIDLEGESGWILDAEKYKSVVAKYPDRESARVSFVNTAKKRLGEMQEEFTRYLERSTFRSADEEIDFISRYAMIDERGREALRDDAVRRPFLQMARCFNFVFEGLEGRYEGGASFMEAALFRKFDCSSGSMLIAHLIRQQGDNPDFQQLQNCKALQLKGHITLSFAPQTQNRRFQYIFDVAADRSARIYDVNYYRRQYYPRDQYEFTDLVPTLAASQCRDIANFYALGDMQGTRKAIQYAEKAVELNPHHYSSYIGLALCHYKVGDYRSALEAALQAERKWSQDPTVYQMIAWSARGYGRSEVEVRADSMHYKMTGKHVGEPPQSRWEK